MRVYLPYPDYRRSAKCLSDAHLIEQRASCRNLIMNITVPRCYSGDRTHLDPWVECINGVLWLTDATLEERRRRGHDEKGITPWMLYKLGLPSRPDWLGRPDYHEQVKRELLHLAPAHYGKMGWFA